MNFCFTKQLAFWFILFSSSFIYAQEAISDLEIQGDSIVKKGQQFYFYNNIDSAIIYCKIASEKFKQAKAWGRYIGALNDITYIYYADKEYTKFNEAALNAHQESSTYLDINNLYHITAFDNLQAHYYSLGDYQKATEMSREVLNLNLKNNAGKNEVISSYLNLGNSFKSSGDYENAINYLKKGLELQQDSILNDPPTARIFQDIGLVFQVNNQIDSAIYYFEQGTLLLQPVGKDNPLFKQKTDNFLNLAGLWNDKNNLPLANQYLRKALQIIPNDYYKIKAEEIRGEILFSQKKYTQAIQAFETAQSIATKSKKRNTPPFKARRFINLAKVYEASNDFEKTLDTYQEALKVLSTSFESKQYQDNPKIDLLLDKPDALEILSNKAKVLYQGYLNSKTESQLNAAYDTYISATELIRNFRQGILTTASKKTLSEKNIEIYEGAIRTAFELYEKTKDETYKTTAFYLAESNKALLLLESINEQSAKKFVGIPDSLLAQEKDLKLNLAYLQKMLLENKSKGKTSKNTEAEIFNTKRQLDLFTANLEKTYPRYFDLKYKNEPSKISEIQQRLANTNKAFLEYFVGEDHIYLFILTNEKLAIQQIPSSKLVGKNVDILRGIVNNPPGKSFDTDQYLLFTNTANTLYELLIQPALDQLNTKTTDWVIIPDYYLNYIPFDILLRSKAGIETGNLSTASMDYLFEDFNLSYDYSVTLHLKSQDRIVQDFKHNFVGFAPSFQNAQQIASRDCTSDQLYSLRCSEKEVGSIAKLTNGKKYAGAEATRQSFESGIQDYKIIHLATHACIDEQNSNLNKIFLTDDYLSDLDLYNMNLNAELAVLSACNTGSGKLIKGEGVMSLARGFINAGCSSTLISMWSVDDCATSDIMFYFYEGIKQGLSKEKALKAAKVKYLDSVDKSKMHPYYWAAFVPFGDMEAIDLEGPSNWFYYLIPIAVLFLLFLFFRKP